MTQKLRPQFYFSKVFFFIVIHGYLPRAQNIKSDIVPTTLTVQLGTLNSELYVILDIQRYFLGQ